MKRSVLCLSILSVLVPTSVSQTKNYDIGAEKAGVLVIKMSWTGADYDPGPFFSDMGSFEIHVKNTGSKTIAAVNWEFFLIDSVRDRVYDRLKFRTDDKNIKPGETKKLIKTFEYRYDPPDYIRGLVRIMRVEYEDGSLEKYAFSISKCHKIASEALDGEIRLEENEGSGKLLREILYLESTSAVTTKKNSKSNEIGQPKNAPIIKRRVGEPLPRRYSVGAKNHEG